MDLGCVPRLVSLSLALLFSASAEGQTFTAAVGQNVTLPCEAKNYRPFEVVEWSRDEAGLKYVLIFDKANPNLEVPEQSYKDRVDLVNMKEGDVSLKLNNVKPEDSGRYQCYVVRETNRKKRDIQPVNTVYLQVPPGRGHIGLVLMVVAVFAMFAMVAVFVWKKRSVSPPQDETVDPLQA
ncbi:sodium channel subunit beta-2-like [Gambusia affinis]|uniref:sodium channel subunit beta-2-like n=1 Tax=Gambusia affinis TaxID=33528 RepID=UPI001CDD4F0C|nr:sodium channel subunit beta-2-like [Gambusia affinis]